MELCTQLAVIVTLISFSGSATQPYAAVQDLPERFMVWCRAGFQGTFLTAYTDIFYELQTPENC
jgi:hypothetical protein